MSTIISGKNIADVILSEVRDDAGKINMAGVVPGLAIVRVGEDPAAKSYVAAKIKACDMVGISSSLKVLPASATEEDIIKIVKVFNVDPKVHGILVQLPLPKHISEARVIEAIDPKKDVDGLHPVNVGKLLLGHEDGFIPCTAQGIQELLIRSGNDPAGKHVVICGRSNIVGKPTAILLARKMTGGNATVTMTHTGTSDLGHFTRQADILVVAIGKSRIITADMVKDSTVVIDVGVNQVGVSKGKKRILTGDVDFEEVAKKAKVITPVPGGVGPMTVAMLMKNVIKATQMSRM